MGRIAWLLAFFAPVSFAYIRQTTVTANPIPLLRANNTAISFYMNSSIVPGAQSAASGANVRVISADSNPQAAIRAALATWSSVKTTSINFLPLLVTSAVNDPNDFKSVIAMGSTPADLSVVGGALAVTLNMYSPSPASLVNGQLLECSANCTFPAAGIYDSDIILNPAYTFSTTGAAGSYDLQAVMTHEFGHSLGASHTGILGATMFQNNTAVEESLSTDDVAFVSFAYPSGTSPATFGTLAGTVTGQDGSPMAYAMLTLAEASTGASFGSLTNTDGTYSIHVPPGSYQLYAEPLNGAVEPQNLYLSPAESALVRNFQSTMFHGKASVRANDTSTANIAVASGTSSLGVSYLAVADGNGNIPARFFAPGPVLIPSGASVDLLIVGAGFDGSLTAANFAIFGQGISIHPDGVRLDPGHANVGGAPVLRVRLDVAARETLSLASLFVTKGSSTLSLSGALVVGPQAPVATSQGFVSAASGLGNGNGNGAVSPGEYVAVYGDGFGPTGGPVYGGFLNSGYDAYGLLPWDLAGVTVTFDGVPAPLFFVDGLVPGSSHGQMNLQVPFEVAGKASTQVVVNFFGSASQAVTVPVLASHPAFFTTGATTAYIGNQNPDPSGNYTNTVNHPAARGDYITVYGTGVGMPYPMQTGVGAPAPPGYSANGFSCTIGGIGVPVLFAGWTPTAVALAQWNLQVPGSLTATGAIPIQCGNTNGSTQPGLTVFVN